MARSLDDYAYDLPAELIAQHPLSRRSDARLLVVDRVRESLAHSRIAELPSHLRPGDVLVLNDSKVIPARLVGYRRATRGRWEGLYLRDEQDGAWRILCKTRGRLMPGEDVVLLDHRAKEFSTLRMLQSLGSGEWLVACNTTEPTWEFLQRVGRIPLPHYIRDGEMLPEDRQAYQTVYAHEPGSVAAPTAGLHFTNDLLQQLDEHGVSHEFVTLHVGMGTFRPISTTDVTQHRMHTERGHLSAPVAEQLEAARQAGGRIIAVGTTSCRVLESAHDGLAFRPWSGETSLYIYPPYTFRATDGLLTNFHLSKSTLLVLVRTFGGDPLIRHAYEVAIREEYRFFSYGDAMLIL